MVVVDANLLVALASGDPRGNKVLQHFTDWLSHNVEVHAPLLALYTANALTRLIGGGSFPADKGEEAWNNISSRLHTTGRWVQSGLLKSLSH